MSRLLAVLAGLLILHLALLAVPARGDAASEASASTGPRVGIVFDVGGRGDKSFNDGAWADDLVGLSSEYPNVRFAGVDLAVRTDEAGRPLPLPPNLAALKFREEEGSFLVGAIAALAGGSKRVGFVGGMDIPLIHKFEDGYRQGVLAVCPDCEVVAQYAGATPEAFRNPSKGKELALSQYQGGVNVIFHASGSTGLGVFEAARTADKLAIGVDAVLAVPQVADAEGRQNRFIDQD